MDITISPRWKANLSKLVIASLVFPSGLASSASVAKASGYEVLINEVKARGSEYIELFNSGAETVDLTDWKITSAQNGLVANLSGELAGGELKMVEVDDLDNSNDVVSLKDDTDSTKDYVSYGYGAKDLPAADTGKSIARKSNGHSLWLSNVEPSLGENNNYSGPSMPANLRIKVSDLNPANTVNHETQDQAQVSYSVDNQAAQVELQAWDLTGQNKNEIVRSPNSGENSDELNVSNLADGHIYISAYSEDAAGVRSAWLNPVTIGKDTDGPAAPVITMPADKVEANKPNYLIEGSAPKANKINIYNDDKVLVAEMDLDSSEFEISVPLMSGKNKFELVARDQAWNWSDEAKVPTITASNLPLSAPLNLSATADDNRAKLSWMKPVSGGEVEGYRVYWDNQSGQINYNSPLVSLN
ncbi:lamin tail domain-containing protein, partial [Candidatus Berkelbacteria bacterium]|nr:lamin tail domain-containing protein [Candidatus Berkelbacteria bacterium]